MFKKVLPLLLLFTAGALYAQSADRITEMLESSSATYGQVCYISAVYKGLIDDTATEEDAVSALKNAGIISAAVQPSDTVQLSSLAGLYAKIWKIKGGLFYTLFHNDRYAFRELKAQGIIPDSSDPEQQVSGRTALSFFNACMDAFGGTEKEGSQS